MINISSEFKWKIWLKPTQIYDALLDDLTTDLKIKTGSSILLLLDSDVEANGFGLDLASQYGCHRYYIACILS